MKIHEIDANDFCKGKKLSEYWKTKDRVFIVTYGDITFDKLAVEVIGKTQTAQLRKMANFSFERHPSLNLDEDRLQKIEALVKKRAIQLLALAKTRSAKKKEG